MSAMASNHQRLLVCSTVGPGADQKKHQSSASLAFVRGIQLWPANSPHKGPVTLKMFPFDYIIILPRYIESVLYWSGDGILGKHDDSAVMISPGRVGISCAKFCRTKLCISREPVFLIIIWKLNHWIIPVDKWQSTRSVTGGGEPGCLKKSFSDRKWVAMHGWHFVCQPSQQKHINEGNVFQTYIFKHLPVGTQRKR